MLCANFGPSVLAATDSGAAMPLPVINVTQTLVIPCPQDQALDLLNLEFGFAYELETPWHAVFAEAAAPEGDAAAAHPAAGCALCRCRGCLGALSGARVCRYVGHSAPGLQLTPCAVGALPASASCRCLSGRELPPCRRRWAVVGARQGRPGVAGRAAAIGRGGRLRLRVSNVQPSSL